MPKKKIAVVQNEFGPGIEKEAATFLLGENGEQLPVQAVVLPNGCICKSKVIQMRKFKTSFGDLGCSVKDDLLMTVENIAKSSERFDYIFVECYGLSDPTSVASVFWVDEALESILYLDAILCFIDAFHIWENWNELETSQQIACADVIIINKIDLVSDPKLETLEQQIKSVNPIAKILKSVKSHVNLDQVLNLQCFSNEKVLPMLQSHFTGLSSSQSSPAIVKRLCIQDA